MRERGQQGDGGTVGVADQDEGGAGPGQHRLDELDLVAQADEPIRRPVRAFARAVGVRCQDMVGGRQALAQVAPLAGGAGIGVQADHCWAMPGFEHERRVGVRHGGFPRWGLMKTA
ncbi:hypothetical protein D3C84_877890 [compost metagenome]